MLTESILDILEQENEAGVKEWRLERLAVARGPRSAADTAADDVLGTGYALLARYSDAVDPPKLLAISIAAREAGGSEAAVHTRIKRDVCRHLVEYLWRCQDHGGLRLGPEAVIWPCVFPSAVSSDGAGPPSSGAATVDGMAGGGSATAPLPSSRPPPAGAEAGDSSRKRRIGELLDLADGLESRSVAGGGGYCEGDSETGSQAGDSAQSSRKPLTFVSVPDKVSCVLVWFLCETPHCCTLFPQHELVLM